MQNPQRSKTHDIHASTSGTPRPPFYQLGQSGRNLSSTSLDSQALLDHRCVVLFMGSNMVRTTAKTFFAEIIHQCGLVEKAACCRVHSDPGLNHIVRHMQTIINRMTAFNGDNNPIVHMPRPAQKVRVTILEQQTALLCSLLRLMTAGKLAIFQVMECSRGKEEEVDMIRGVDGLLLNHPLRADNVEACRVDKHRQDRIKATMSTTHHQFRVARSLALTWATTM